MANQFNEDFEAPTDYDPSSCLFQVLGASRDCDRSGLRKAFKRSALKHHPDRGGTNESMRYIKDVFEWLKLNLELYKGWRRQCLESLVASPPVVVQEGPLVLAGKEDFDVRKVLLKKRRLEQPEPMDIDPSPATEPTTEAPPRKKRKVDSQPAVQPTAPPSVQAAARPPPSTSSGPQFSVGSAPQRHGRGRPRRVRVTDIPTKSTRAGGPCSNCMRSRSGLCGQHAAQYYEQQQQQKQKQQQQQQHQHQQHQHQQQQQQPVFSYNVFGHSFNGNVQFGNTQFGNTNNNFYN